MLKISYKRSERVFDIDNFDYVRPLHKKKRINHTSTNPNHNTTENISSHKKLNAIPHSIEKLKNVHSSPFNIEHKNKKPLQKKLKNKKNEKNTAKILNPNNNFCLSNSTNKKCISPNKISLKQNLNKYFNTNPTTITRHNYSFREKKTLSLRNYITNTTVNSHNKFKQLENSSKKKYINQTLKNIISPSIKIPYGFANTGNNHQNHENKNKVGNKVLQNSAFNLKTTNNDGKKISTTEKLKTQKKTVIQGDNSGVQNKDSKKQINTRIKVPTSAKQAGREGKSQSYNVNKKMRRPKVF